MPIFLGLFLAIFCLKMAHEFSMGFGLGVCDVHINFLHYSLENMCLQAQKYVLGRYLVER